MRAISSCFLGAFLVHFAVFSGEAQAVDVLSYHGSNLVSDGVNASETAITTANVNTIQKLFTTDITDIPNVTGIPASTLPSGINYTAAAGQVYAQPLLKTGVNITTGNFKGLHDVVFVATSMNSLYAIDAAGGTVLWKDSFIYNSAGNPNPLNTAIALGITAVPGGFGTETNSQDVSPWIGVLGTPVIDAVNGYIYLTAKTREARNSQAKPHYVYRLHKVRMSDGLDVSTIIADTQLLTSTTYTFTSGPYVTGAASDASSGKVYFNAVRQMIRPALKLYNNRIYIASASHGDNQPYHGWILTYTADATASVPVINGAWNSTPNGREGGVWQGGGSVVIDSNGFIYFETGNGTFDGTTTGNVVSGLDANGFPVNGNYSNCFMKLTLDPSSTQTAQGTNKNGWGLKVADYFSPYNNQALSGNDTDLGAGGPTILPDSVGSAAHPHLLSGSGKEGKLYLLDRDNMGKFATSDALAVQTVNGSLNSCFSTTAYFNGRVYATSGFGGTMVSWPLTNATITTGGIQNTPDQIAFPGCSPSISANGTTNGVLWLVDKGTGQLRAYNPANIASQLWTSNLNAARDGLGAAVKFSVPTPVNGKVYVGTADHLVAYGLPAPPTAAPAAPSGLKIGTVGPSTIALSWVDNSANEAGFSIERSSDNVNFSEVGTVGVNQVTFSDSGLSSQATYRYRVRAFNSFNTLSYSNYTTIVAGTTSSLNSQTPVNLYHFDEGAGTAAADSVGGNNGTLIGTAKPGWTAGKIGGSSLSFSGNGQYLQNGQSAVQVGSDLAPTLGGTSSLLFWVKTTQIGSDTHYEAPAVTGVEQRANSNDISWGFLDSIGRIGVSVGDNGSVFSADPINDGQWHHVAMSRDVTSGNVKIYVDGSLDTSINLEGGSKTSQFRLIGALSDVMGDGTTFEGANFFNGQLDDVQIYNVVIDPAVVAAIALPPAAPTNLVVTPFSGTELDLTWTDNASNESNYSVWNSVNNGAWTKVATLGANITSYAHTGLTPNTTYSYFVEAVNSVGYADSSTVTVTTPIPPTTPSNATVTYLSPTEIDLVWTDNATNEVGYRVLRSINSGTYAQIASFGPDATAYQDFNVQPGTSYSYHIQAYNIAGYSDFAGRTISTPAQSQYLTYLSGYGLTSQSATDVAADPDNDGISNLLEYAFASNPNQSSVTNLPVVGTTNGYLSITFTQQIPPTDLYYTVQVSSDMVTWTSGPGSTTQLSVTPIDSTTQRVTVRDNVLVTTSPNRFIRVNVKH